ncbi:MAG: hypothetical protein NUV77_09120, partial [Thermoguttaceae bacterium]|nr:hypothetical protein [Thermoguttaceae bacterium]
MDSIAPRKPTAIACFLLAWLAAPAFAAEAGSSHAGWTFCCRADNDLFRAVTAAGVDSPRFDSPVDAVRSAPAGSGVLVLADGYPDKPNVVAAEVFDAAARKRLRLYVEYADRLPDLAFGPPKDVKYERGVVESDFFGGALPKGRIVLVSSGRYLPVQSNVSAHLVAAKVAGVDTAVYGLANTPAEPLLFDHPRADMLVATTALSHFVRARYLPTDDWRTIWQAILARLHPQHGAVAPQWTPTVRPSYGPGDPLPDDFAAQAVRRSADWVVASRALRHRDWPAEALALSATYNTVRDMPSSAWPVEDGSFGLLEGFSSTIRRDGSQPMRYAVRNDCNMEAAMLLACDADLNARPENARRAARLVDYILGESGLAGGTRADPKSPSFGLIGWALDSPNAYWGDDNGRAILAVAAVAALCGERRWNDAMVRCILANFRTTGASGFRQECIQEKTLAERGWTSFYTSRAAWYSPHHQAWPWACYLWAYRQSGYAPLLVRTKAGIRAMMQAYPARWNWILRSGTIERSRMLLALAWLVRVDD